MDSLIEGIKNLCLDNSEMDELINEFQKVKISNKEEENIQLLSSIIFKMMTRRKCAMMNIIPSPSNVY